MIGSIGMCYVLGLVLLGLVFWLVGGYKSWVIQ